MMEQLKKDLFRIRCRHILTNIESYLQQGREKELSNQQFLSYIMRNEVNSRNQTAINLKLKRSNFPSVKTFEEFDYKYQHSVTKRMVNEWLDFDWIDNRENKILMGPPGVGKTHIAISLGYAAIQKGYNVKFYTFNDLLDDMLIATNEQSLKEFIKKLCKNELVIIDEIGYLPIKEISSSMFFKLVSELYEFRSIVITSNKLFQEWGSAFGDNVITSAILDRLLHHAQLVTMDGDSYRMKGKI